MSPATFFLFYLVCTSILFVFADHQTSYSPDVLVGAYQTNRLTDELVQSTSRLVRSSLDGYIQTENNAPKTARKLIKITSHRTQVVAGINTEIKGYFKDDCGGQVLTDKSFSHKTKFL